MDYENNSVSERYNINLLKSIELNDKYKFKRVFPLVGRDFFKMMIGLALSIVIVFAIHGFAFSGLANM